MNAQSPLSAELHEQADHYDRMAEALSWLAAHAEAQPALGELAAHMGLSEFHVQKLFARWAGISPKRFLQHLSHERARAALRAGEDLLSVSAAAGLSGPGRLHDLLVTCEAVSPGEFKSGGAGLHISWGVAATPFGPALLASSARGLMKLAFTDDEGLAEFSELQQEWPAAQLQRDDAAAAALAARLFSAYQKPEPVHLFVKGSQFQLKVWQALLQLPEGRLLSYGALARAIGQPAASRAVGSAVGANPVALLIPCHRVIRANGVLGEYRWGEARKRVLVGLELALHEEPLARHE
ncbi:MAG: methylated-DNA--[protein]-cysteine S-methyltransferase [Pedobacter sp.]|nr:methylated-DNA--[protein]-cysteine S-methyltransferase [Pedobacter sp.]